jgi:uncharacterized protein YkwD
MSIFCWIIVSMVVSFFVSLPSPLVAEKHSQKIPESESEIRAMEREIWKLLNEERAGHQLSLLNLSPTLSEIARKHSQDMAEHGELSHLSSTGKTLSDRLAEAQIHYIEAGENIAFSETYVSAFINESLIESPEHSENILDPDFKEVGIGIVHIPDKGYYVTQNFLDPLHRKADSDVNILIQQEINSRRQASSLPPLVFMEEREPFAQNLSKLKAQDSEIPPLPERFGETLVLFLMIPSLPNGSLVFPEALDARYDMAALGTWFDQTQSYPGGSYFITLMLFASNRFEGLSRAEQTEIIFSQINSLRIRAHLKEFILSSRLSDIANRIVKVAANNRNKTAVFPIESTRAEVFTYGTEDLQILPESLEKRVLNSKARKVGIGLLFRKDNEYPQGAFWVALLME